MIELGEAEKDDKTIA
jgi:hypothetical protein